MKNSESLKRRLQNTDDEALKQMIEAMSAASGISEERKNAIIADIPRIRKLLTEADEEKLSAMISAMGKGRFRDTIRKMNEEDK